MLGTFGNIPECAWMNFFLPRFFYKHPSLTLRVPAFASTLKLKQCCKVLKEILAFMRRLLVPLDKKGKLRVLKKEEQKNG